MSHDEASDAPTWTPLRAGASIARYCVTRHRLSPLMLPRLESLLLGQPGRSSGVLTENCASASARLSGSTRLIPSAVIHRNSGSLSTSCSAVDTPLSAQLWASRRWTASLSRKSARCVLHPRSHQCVMACRYRSSVLCHQCWRRCQFCSQISRQKLSICRTYIFKQVIDLLALFVAELFNRSLAADHFPGTFKDASITPVLKKQELQSADASSYRPISNLTVLSN